MRIVSILLLSCLSALTACGDKDGEGGEDGSSGEDADGDGYTADEDCDDADASISPDADEVCDGVDNDCDGLVDDEDDSLDPTTASIFYGDSDGDGYGAPDVEISACVQPSGAADNAEDCDDDDPVVNPAAVEVCDDDDTDEDCSGDADDADSGLDASTQIAYSVDADGDGYGDVGDAGALYCDPPSGLVADRTDCDDGDGSVNPGATEVCDDADTDEDCSGDADDADAGVDASTQATFYPDADSDGYGDEDDAGTLYCDPPSGLVTDHTDCDDARSGVNPGATEVCDAGDTDEDCDGAADDADSSVDPSTQSRWYSDSDSDGYGDEDDAGTLACDAPSGAVAYATDCDDTDAAISPAATEICDASDTDEDCDGLADDDDASVDPSGQTTTYPDADSDGYGDEDDAGTPYCDPPGGVVTDNSDCDDSAAAVNPAATEVCDASDTDEDCDGLADDDDSGVRASSQTRYYDDSDNDGYGDEDDAGTLYCDPPGGVVTDDSDCDDGDSGVNPGATEVCDASDTDEDCDGLADDDDASVDPSGQTTYYADADGDGFGDEDDSGTAYCDAPSGVVTDDTDCDDSSTAIYPGATEQRQNGIDEDCDGEDAPYILSDLGTGDLVLTEILQNPLASDDRYGEWFEVLNDSGGEVDLDGLAVWDLGSNSFTVSGTLRVEDGDYAVFGPTDDTSLNGDVAIDYVYSNMALGNSSDELYLADAGSTAYTVIYDSVEWDNGATFPDPNGASMTLSLSALDASDNDDGENWCEASSTFGDGDYGTPGDDNDPCTTTFGPGASAGGSSGTYGASYMLGQPVTLSQSIVLTGFGAEVHTGTPDLYAALYTDSGGSPGSRVAYSALTSTSAGDNELAVSGGAVSVAAGTYWLIINGGPSNYQLVEDSSGSVTTWYASRSYASTPPATASSGTTFSYDQTAAWLIGY